MRRHLSWIFASTMLIGGLAACGDDDDDNGDTDTEETTTTTEGEGGDDSGDDSGDGGNAEVQAYCDDVEAVAAELEEAGVAGLADLQDELTALQESGTELAANSEDLDEEDAEALADCTQVLTDAATGLGG